MMPGGLEPLSLTVQGQQKCANFVYRGDENKLYLLFRGWKSFQLCLGGFITNIITV